jgi:hypothetical protein
VNVIFFVARKGIPSCVLFCSGMVRNGIPRILVPRNGIPSCVLFRRRVRNRITGVCFYFCSTERNTELFSLPRKGSERNSETTGIPSEITICSDFSVFHGIIFLSEISNPIHEFPVSSRDVTNQTPPEQE